MEWRTSCAALWAAAICEKPTPQIMNTPRKAAMLAAIRVFDRVVEIAAVWVLVMVVIGNSPIGRDIPVARLKASLRWQVS